MYFMEQFNCLECGSTFGYRKTLGRHVRDVHKMQYVDYLSRHGQSEVRACHCGQTFENTRYPGGPRAHGRRQIHCSKECVQIATNCRTRGLPLAEYWRLQALGCAICMLHETTPGKRMLAIDHDHETGMFRGLLCNVCNGHRVGANTLETARAVVAYLERALEKARESVGEKEGLVKP